MCVLRSPLCDSDGHSILRTTGIWNTGTGKVPHGPDVEMGCFRLCSQGRPHGGGDLDQKAQAMGRAGEKCSPARSRKWLQGVQRGGPPGDEVEEAG